MAMIESVSMIPETEVCVHTEETKAVFPGLRIKTRTTSSSLSDYPEWDMAELAQSHRSHVVTDGACS